MMMRRVLLAVVAAAAFCAASVTSLPSTQAADNDFDLSRFAEFRVENCTPPNCPVKKNVALFEDLVTDFGQVMAPKLVAPAETLGEAGFAVQFVPSISFIPNDEVHWQRAVQGNTVPRDGQGQIQPRSIVGDSPSPVMFTPQLIVRKGLPFSLEYAGTFSHIAGSDMFTVGSQLKWALNEGFRMFPDVAVRGAVNTLLGSKDLEMLTVSWDISISKAFPIAGVMSIAPYAGYQQLHAWGWSRLLNIYPQDPRAPQASGGSVFNPEFVFETYHDAINRFFIGGRFNVWNVSLVPEVVIGEGVHTVNLSAGLDF